MPWAIAGLVYSATYVVVVAALAGHGGARLVVGNIGLLLPPLATLMAIARRRAEWEGC